MRKDEIFIMASWLTLTLTLILGSLVMSWNDQDEPIHIQRTTKELQLQIMAQTYELNEPIVLVDHSSKWNTYPREQDITCLHLIYSPLAS